MMNTDDNKEAIYREITGTLGNIKELAGSNTCQLENAVRLISRFYGEYRGRWQLKYDLTAKLDPIRYRMFDECDVTVCH